MADQKPAATPQRLVLRPQRYNLVACAHYRQILAHVLLAARRTGRSGASELGWGRRAGKGMLAMFRQFILSGDPYDATSPVPIHRRRRRQHLLFFHNRVTIMTLLTLLRQFRYFISHKCHWYWGWWLSKSGSFLVNGPLHFISWFPKALLGPEGEHAEAY